MGKKLKEKLKELNSGLDMARVPRFPLSIYQAAKLLEVPRSEVRRYIREDRLEANYHYIKRVDGGLCFSQKTLEEFKEQGSPAIDYKGMTFEDNIINLFRYFQQAKQMKLVDYLVFKPDGSGKTLGEVEVRWQSPSEGATRLSALIAKTELAKSRVLTKTHLRIG